MKNRLHSMQKPDDLFTKEVIGMAMKVHRTLGSGFVETVYRNALVLELRKANLSFECHPTHSVMYEGTEVGVFQADLIIAGKLIVELKAVTALANEHSTQLINYLNATKIENGLLLNFGTSSLEFRTKTRTYHFKQDGPNLQS